MMRENNPSFTFVGSSENEHAVYKRACDEWYVEPGGLSEREYVDFCIDFCKKHKIDVFVPRRNLTQIVLEKERFDALGVKLFADDCKELQLILDDKIKTYEYIREINKEIVPDFYVATSLEEFKEGYGKLKEKGYTVCYKLTVDEGARSFRVVKDDAYGASSIYEKPGSKITLEHALIILSSYDFSVPVLLMPYLNGVEISIDCMKMDDESIIIPRYKTSKRFSTVKFDKEIMALCKELLDRLNCKMVMNVQFKLLNNKPYLLEINPRMSGGLQLSCKASGINLPSVALNYLLGKKEEWRYPEFTSAKVVHIETPVCLD